MRALSGKQRLQWTALHTWEAVGGRTLSTRMLPWRRVRACWIATCPASASPNTYTEGEDPLAGESVIGRGPIRSTAVAQTAVMTAKTNAQHCTARPSRTVAREAFSYMCDELSGGRHSFTFNGLSHTAMRQQAHCYVLAVHCIGTGGLSRGSRSIPRWTVPLLVHLQAQTLPGECQPDPLPR